MFELIEVNIDTEKVAKYRKYDDSTSTFLDSKAYTIIPTKYRESYFNELKSLLNRYKVSETHLGNFLYILGQHLFIYDIIKEKKEDAVECHEPLKFLYSYQLQTQDIASKAKSGSALKRRLDSRYIEIMLPNYKEDTPITLGNTDFVVKAIYQLFKQQYQIPLKELLLPYEEIPPIAITYKLLNEMEYIINHATHYLVAEIAVDLLDYLNTYMTGELSRKQYLFISDLLLLSALFRLTEDTETELFELTTDFKPQNLINVSKTTYLKRVIRNYRKHLANSL